jgi:hypothetical protein
MMPRSPPLREDRGAEEGATIASADPDPDPDLGEDHQARVPNGVRHSRERHDDECAVAVWSAAQ